MSIRSFEERDLCVIVDIADRAWMNIRKMSRDALGNEISDILRPDGDDVSKGKEVAAEAAKFPQNIFVCERGGRVVGFVTFVMDDNLVGTIGNNAVDPECGEKGVGQEMYQAVFDHFKQHNMKVACVTTGLDYAHAPARKAYLRAGFDRELRSVTYFRKLD